MLLLAAALAAPPPEPASVFDRLFGSEPARVDASADNRAGNDSLALVGLYLGSVKLAEDLTAYRVDGTLCLPVGPVLDALGIAHQSAGGDVELRLFEPARTRRLAADRLRPTPGGGRCLPLAAWSAAIGGRLTDDPVNLRVVIEPAEPLPVMARLAREERRREGLRPTGPQRAPFAAAANPWRWWSPPTLDVTLGGVLSSRGSTGLATIEASGDVLRMTGRARASLDERGRGVLRLSLSRDGAAGELPFGIRTLSIGDVATPAQPLIAAPAAGRGLLLTTRPSWRADLFDTIELRGPLPAGWEAELHRDDQLLAVVTAADAAGDWVFADVPLRTGENRYVVKLYGPHGETDQQVITRVVGAELNPENETHWTVGIVDPGRPLIGPAPGQAPAAPAAFASVEHGLGAGLSGRLDLRAPLDGGRPRVGAGLYATLLGGYGSVLVAGTGRGPPALAMRAARRFGTLQAALELADYGARMPGPEAPPLARELRRQAGLTLSSRLAIGGRSLPVQLSASHGRERSGAPLTRLDSQIALAIGGARFVHRLSAEWRPTGAIALGGFGATVASGRWRLRGLADYRLAPRPGVDRIGGAVTRAGSGTSLGAEAGWDFRQGGPTMSVALSRSFGPIAATAAAGLAPGDRRIGLSLSLGLFRDGRHGWRIGPPGLSRTGAIRPHLFIDEDGDDRFGPGDRSVADGRFLVDATVRPETTGPNGRSLITGLAPGRPMDLEPQLAGLPDLALRPSRPGLSLALRPGQVLDLPVALRMTGDVEVRLLRRRGDTDSVLAGAPVRLERPDGTLVATTVTDFDGYAFFDGLLPGRYRVAAPGAAVPPLPLSIDRDQPHAAGLVLLVPADGK